MSHERLEIEMYYSLTGPLAKVKSDWLITHASWLKYNWLITHASWLKYNWLITHASWLIYFNFNYFRDRIKNLIISLKNTILAELFQNTGSPV
jgi:hypothetical protein